MNQKVEYLNIEDLVLWTENPRDPIDARVSDQHIVDRALDDKLSKWTLAKLAKEMGAYYDFSELPTIVYHGQKPVVYDGNRRIILGKIQHGLVSIPEDEQIDLPEIPKKIPCNICDKKTALQNVYRKHIDDGSWMPLERDMFLHKFMGKEKSTFLVLEDETGIISANPILNQRFVKDEIFRADILKSMGFVIDNERLKSVHSDQEAYSILSDIAKKVEDKEITTRKNRGKAVEVLEPASQKTIDNNKKNKTKRSEINFKKPTTPQKPLKRSKRKRKKKTELFGGKLYLRIGAVSNLYRDIDDLYGFYVYNKNKLSDVFPSLIRMSLRLLCEAAAKSNNNQKFDNYIKKYFLEARKNLDQNMRTTLSNQNVNEKSLVQLLHTGAHNYKTSSNMEQTMVMSVIIGEILTITHGKDE